MIAFLRRRWSDALALALVILCFCVPLFLGLDRWDLRNDESIYSYAAIRIVETGEWLTPRAIPFDGPFLEKPPLKFWMVAAPMALGLTPPDETGFRVVDALLGAIAFVYVYLLARWQAGPVAGLAAVLVLYTLDPLVFDHGLRSDNMEASLVLCYAGGIYHFLRWVDGDGTGRAARHRWPFALYFTLGFLTKFVAVLFLPLVCAGAVAMRRDRQHLLRSWRPWLGPAALFVALSAPWFVYQTVMTGRYVWQVMFWQHVYTRFTGALDVHHLQPWYYYLSNLWTHLTNAGSQWLAVAGAVALGIAGFRRDGWLARVFLFWGVVPVALISCGSSKVFHYVFPFLPPIGLGAGLLAAGLFRLVTHVFERFAAPWIRKRMRPLVESRDARWRAAGWMLAGVAVGSLLIGIVTAVNGGLNLSVDDVRVFRNASLTRPFLVAALLLVLAGSLRWAARAIGVALLMIVLPVAVYPSKIERSMTVNRPLHVARDCILSVERSGDAVGDTVYDAAGALTHHGYHFYLRALEPWVRADRPDVAELERRLFEPGKQSPVLLRHADYSLVTDVAVSRNLPPFVGFSTDPGLVMVLPGPFAKCAAPAARAGALPIGFAIARPRPR
jgi:4-amino-4-deoxy-L-arabinose transferase-like glycosyltransferase